MKKIDESENKLKELIGDIQLILENKNPEKLDLLLNEFCNELTKYIFEHETDEIISRLKEIWDNEQFWNQITEKTNPIVGPFLQVRALRKLDDTTLIDYIQKSLSNKYFEYETESYFSDVFRIDADIAKSLYILFNICERIIILQMASKRRFKDLMNNKLKLKSNVSEELWRFYDEKRNVLEKQVYYSRIVTLDVKISNLLKVNNKALEELDFIEYLIMSEMDTSENNDEQIE